MRPRSSMITTASNVASRSASTSDDGVDMPRQRYSGQALLLNPRREFAMKQPRIDLGFGRQPVLGFMSGRKAALLRAEVRGLGDERGALLRAGERRVRSLRRLWFRRRALLLDGHGRLAL